MRHRYGRHLCACLRIDESGTGWADAWVPLYIDESGTGVAAGVCASVGEIGTRWADACGPVDDAEEGQVLVCLWMYVAWMPVGEWATGLGGACGCIGLSGPGMAGACVLVDE